MKFSEHWLREWVNPAVDSKTLAEQITMAGLEVDDIQPVAGPFSGVVTGKVVTCRPHPNADKLKVTQVDIGQPELLNIVCGAPNCREGLFVAVAQIGAVLPGDFKIKAAKLRGEPSEGMLCSWSELGISEDHSGIMELPENIPLGIDLRDYLQLDDHIIDVSLTPNRADCLSIAGLAREVAVLNDLPFTAPDIQPAAIGHQDVITVENRAPEACPRYLCRIVRGVNPQAQTPLWMQEKLRRCGIRSVDPVVDVTNYVLLELGQPMHAFDRAQIDGGIVVRQACAGETLTLLDGNTVTLTDDVLVIADQHKPLAMAGIFGGAASGVQPQTRDIVLESAFFAPLAVVGRARRYGLHTEASHRYERGVDPQLAHRAMERATALLLQICGGSAGPVVESCSEAHLPQPQPITLRRLRLDSLIGVAVPAEQVSAILTALGCRVMAHESHWQVTPPDWRFDLTQEVDLIEEVARVFGYDQLPNVPPRAALTMAPHREAALPLASVRQRLCDCDYQEVITYSFVDPKIQALLHPEQEALALPSPVSADMSAMRLSLWPGLLGCALYNQNRQQSRLRLFESGLRFIPDASAELGVRQELLLAGLATGPRTHEHWDQPRQNVDYFDVKGDVEAVLALTGHADAFEFRRASHPALHPGQSAAIYLHDQQAGWLGVLHPELERKLGLNGRTVLFELSWAALAEREIPQAQPVSRFPANRRDIAVVVAEETPAAAVIEVCRQAAGPQLTDVQLFDVYRGKGVAEGKKSLAISLILQDTTRTLEEEEIAALVGRCVAALQQRFQASLRD